MLVERAEIDVDCEDFKLRCSRIYHDVFIEKNDIEYDGTILITQCDDNHFIIEIYINHDNSTR